MKAKGNTLVIDNDFLLLSKPWQDANGYWRHGDDLYIHRSVMEYFLGRSLSKKEVVHHKDRNPANNKLDNLVLFPSNSEHITHHAREDCILAGFDPDNYLICSRCKTYHLKDEFAKWKNSKRGYAQACRKSFNTWRKQKGLNKNKWTEQAKILQQIRRAKAKALIAKEGRSL